MEVILLQRIESLGQMGDVVNVKPGYARNYLLPQKKALRATEDNRRQFEERRTQLEADNLDRRNDAEAVAAKMGDLTIYLQRQAGDAGQLYGSVSAGDIAIAVSEAGFTLTRKQVQLDRPIKAIGLHTVRLDLHPEVAVAVTANVARSEEEASVQAKTGRAVVHADEDVAEDEAAAVVAVEEVFEAPTEEIIEDLVGKTTEEEAAASADTADGASTEDGAEAPHPDDTKATEKDDVPADQGPEPTAT
jgi:large subunit ribosomal protein L9